MKTIFLFLLLFHLNSYATEQVTYKFGIVPQQSATILLEKWAPLIKKMSQDCSCKIEFQTASDITQFELNIKKGEYDLVYLNPFHFVENQSIGYNALVREEDRKLVGVLVVKKDSPIKTLEDLNKKQIAFPGPTAFAASILVTKLLNSKKVSFDPLYVKSHESVYLNVISGLTAAGGGVNRTLDALSDADKNQLRVLATTQGVTPHPIAIHKRVNTEIKNLFLKTLTNLKNSVEGKQMLDNLELKYLIQAKNSDWDDVRKIIEITN